MKKANSNVLIKILKTIAIPVCMFVALKIFFPANITMDTAGNMIYQAVAPSILAWGVLFGFKAGNWDFSPGATALASGIIGGNFAMMLGMGFFGIILFCALFGILFGLLTGGLYIWLKVPTIIVSIGVVFLLESLCGVVFNGEGIMVDSSAVVLNSFVPQIIFGIAAFLLAIYLYNFRSFGYHVRAVGNGTNIAAQSGINIYKVKFQALVVTGLFAGLFAAVTLGTSGVMRTVSASMGSMGTVFDAMMCMFVAMALGQFVNIVVAVFVGAVTLQFLKLTLMLIGLNSSYNQIIVAIFVLIFMCVSSASEIKRMAEAAKYRIMASKANEAEKKVNEINA